MKPRVVYSMGSIACSSTATPFTVADRRVGTIHLLPCTHFDELPPHYRDYGLEQKVTSIGGRVGRRHILPFTRYLFARPLR